MANRLVDFQLIRRTDTLEERLWKFRFGRCEDFYDTLDQVKLIPLSERKYIEDDEHLWEIKPSPYTEVILAKAFDNFESCLEAARAQLPLFRNGGRVHVQ